MLNMILKQIEELISYKFMNVLSYMHSFTTGEAARVADYITTLNTNGNSTYIQEYKSKFKPPTLRRLDKIYNFSLALNQTDDVLTGYHYMGFPYDIQTVKFVKEFPLICLFIQVIFGLLIVFGGIALVIMVRKIAKNPGQYKLQ